MKKKKKFANDEGIKGMKRQSFRHTPFERKDPDSSDSITQTCARLAVFQSATILFQHFSPNGEKKEREKRKRKKRKKRGKRKIVHPSGPLNSQRVWSRGACRVAGKIDKRLPQTWNVSETLARVSNSPSRPPFRSSWSAIVGARVKEDITRLKRGLEAKGRLPVPCRGQLDSHNRSKVGPTSDQRVHCRGYPTVSPCPTKISLLLNRVEDPRVTDNLDDCFIL